MAVIGELMKNRKGENKAELGEIQTPVTLTLSVLQTSEKKKQESMSEHTHFEEVIVAY